MKTTILFLTSLFFAINLIAQSIETVDKELYPDKYTFERADEFQRKGDYEKAIWFYINLYPNNKTKVVEIVKAISVKMDTVSMDAFIKKTFALYGTFDPSITKFNNGTPTMDLTKLEQKGAWGDELILQVTNSKSSLTSASEYNSRGFEKFKKGDYKGAIEDLNSAIKIEPIGQNYFNRAYAKSMIEDYSGAIQDFNKAIELKYELEESYFERGYCKEQINNNLGAIEDLTKAIEINKDFAKAINNRATLFAKNKDYKSAIKDYDRVIKLIPDKAESYVSRGIAKKELDDKSGACEDWEKAYRLGYKEVREKIYENCK
jgi:tetratricopeptide (TPR) repeat protein